MCGGGRRRRGATQHQDVDGQTQQGGGKGGGAPVVEGGGAQGGRGEEQVARTYQRRKYKLKNGIVRDSLFQVDILNFTPQTEPSGVNLGSTRKTKKVIE
jgi:hypothetical protein